MRRTSPLTLQPPGGAHLFGTDELGRDIFSRLVYGSRITLTIIVARGGHRRPDRPRGRHDRRLFRRLVRHSA